MPGACCAKVVARRAGEQPLASDRDRQLGDPDDQGVGGDQGEEHQGTVDGFTNMRTPNATEMIPVTASSALFMLSIGSLTAPWNVRTPVVIAYAPIRTR
jgi:hypothetical protein